MVGAILGSAALSAASGIASAVGKKRLAKDQMARSQDLRTEAYGVRKPALRPEFQSALQAAKLRTLYGLPNSGSMKDEIDLELATNYGRGKIAATSGGELTQYISSLGAEGSRLKRDINLKDAAMRDQNFGGYMNTLWNVGNEELKNVAIQREERNKLLGQAGALENAATANKFAGNTEIASSIFNAGGQALGGLGNQVGGAAKGNSAMPQSNYIASDIAGTFKNMEKPIGTTTIPVQNSRDLMASSSLMANLTPNEVAQVKALSAQYPDMAIEDLIDYYMKKVRKFQ